MTTLSAPRTALTREPGTPSSVAAAGACAAVAVLAAGSPAFTALHVAMFALGALAFASNLSHGMAQTLRVGAVLAQAICAFEVLGFAIGMSVAMLSGPGGLPGWSTLAIAWAIVVTCGLALRSSVPRILHAPSPRA